MHTSASIMMYMKFQIKRHAVISTLISISIAVFLACTVQPASQNSSSESPKVDELISDSVIKYSVEATGESEMAIEATVEAFIAETQTAEETMNGEISLPRERYALYDAACNNFLDVSTLLIDLGADIEAKNKGEGTPLHLASDRKSLEVARLLINLGANTEGIDLSWMN